MPLKKGVDRNKEESPAHRARMQQCSTSIRASPRSRRIFGCTCLSAACGAQSPARLRGWPPHPRRKLVSGWVLKSLKNPPRLRYFVLALSSDPSPCLPTSPNDCHLSSTTNFRLWKGRCITLTTMVRAPALPKSVAARHAGSRYAPSVCTLANAPELQTSTAETGLPPSWEVRHSNSKNLPYYFNITTKESRWEPPSGTDPQAIKAYMATHHSQSLNPPTNARTANEGKIRAAHLLVKHEGSRRPSSWKEERITRSKAEALEILKGHEKRIKEGGESLGDLAASESDCSSARKKGDL